MRTKPEEVLVPDYRRILNEANELRLIAYALDSEGFHELASSKLRQLVSLVEAEDARSRTTEASE